MDHLAVALLAAADSLEAAQLLATSAEGQTTLHATARPRL